MILSWWDFAKDLLGIKVIKHMYIPPQKKNNPNKTHVQPRENKGYISVTRKSYLEPYVSWQKYLQQWQDIIWLI